MSGGAQAAPLWAWGVFAGLLLGLLVVDLFVHRGERGQGRRAAILWSVVWVGVGLAFSLFVLALLGPDAAGEYLAAWLIEKSLSLDNLFVFLVVFSELHIPAGSQRRVLTWGILGALFFRAAFVLLGVAAIERWQWVTWIFAALLAAAAVRVFRQDPAGEKDSKVAQWLSRHLPVARETHGQAFFAREAGRLRATPMLVALVAVELVDITFAVDSVPAALAVTRDRFVVYSSNAFAILGLRSLFIVLEDVLGRMPYLHYGLAAVLAFAAVKLVTSAWIEIPPLLSVAIIAVLIGASVVASLPGRRRLRARTEQP